MISIVSFVTARLAELLSKAAVDATAQRRRNQYKDKFWTTVELLEDRTLLSGTAPQVELVSHVPASAGGSPGPNVGGSDVSSIGARGRQVSDDGRFVTFSSDANDLVSGDNNPSGDVFVLDRESGSLERISVRWEGGLQAGESDGSSSSPSISADGRYVVFQSDATNLVPGDTNGVSDVFVFDMQMHQTRRVSVDADGHQANAAGWTTSGNASISSDGRYVSFSSLADNLVLGDTNQEWDVFVTEWQTGAIQRVSLTAGGAQASGPSYYSALSGDGQYVVFDSEASLVEGDENSWRDIYLLNLGTGDLRMITASADARSYMPVISADGEFIAFVSDADNLSGVDPNGNPLDTNGWNDVFVYDVHHGIVERVSVASDGTQGNAWSQGATISADGRFVGFYSAANNLDGPVANLGSPGQCYGVFVHDRVEHTTQVVSVASDGGPANSGSTDPSLSADGRFVVFNSNATNLVPEFGGSPGQVFLAYLPPPNTPPVVIMGGATVNEGEALRITAAMLHAADDEQAAGTLVYTVVGTPTNGVLRRGVEGQMEPLDELNPTFTQADIVNGFIWFLHDGGETTEGSFSFTVSDGIVSTETATFDIAVTPVNDAPTLVTTASSQNRTEFRVGDVDSAVQKEPVVGMNSRGDTVVVWYALGEGDDSYDVFAQRYNADGVAQGSSFRVNTHVSQAQNGGQVAVAENGDFVIVWHGNYEPGISREIYAREFNADGTPKGDEFQVNTTGHHGASDPSVAIAPNGDFVVVWNSLQQDDPENLAGVQFGGVGVFAQRFNAAGEPVGTEFQVNTYTYGNQESPSVAMDASGNFVIAWTSYLQDETGYSVYLQRYNADGTAVGGEYRVSDEGLLGRVPVIAMAPDGDFVVAWESYDTNYWGVRAQRFNSAGVEVGDEFRVNTTMEDYQRFPSIAMNSDGDTVISWMSRNQDGDGYGLYAQRFDAAGERAGSEFRVNTFTTGTQSGYSHTVAIDSDGDVVFVWNSAGQDGNVFGIYGRRDAGPHNQLTVREGEMRAITTAQLQTVDVDNSASTLTYTVTALPLYGDLLLNNTPVQDLPVPLTFTQADIDEGRLSYRHRGDEESLADSFRFSVSDGLGGTVEVSEFHITVLVSNDAPTAADGLAFRIQDAPGRIDLARQPDGTSLLSDSETTDVGHFTFEVVSVTHGSYTVDEEISDNGQFIEFTPEAGYLGDAVIRVRATDNGDRGTPPRSVEYDYVVHLTPPIARDDQFVTDEDTPFFSFEVRSNDDVYGQTPSNAVRIVGTEGTRGSVIVNADGTITFTPEANFNGTTSFQYELVNAAGNTRTATVTVEVRSVNDAPAGTDGSVTTREDTPYVFQAADFGFTDGNDAPSDVLATVTITTLPTAGTLTLLGSPQGTVVSGQSILVDDIVAGRLVFTPAENAHGVGYASLTFQVRDNGGTSLNGADFDLTPNTLTIHVLSVNDAPSGADGSTTIVEDRTHVFTLANFGFSDSSDSPANPFTFVTITTLPTAGTLTLDGQAVTAGDRISVADIAANRLVFRPVANAPAETADGAGYATFTFQVQDGGGTLEEGVDLDPSPNTFTVHLTPEADAPVVIVSNPDVVIEDRDGVGVRIPLAVSTTLSDTDGSERLTVIISGVPVGVTLTDGTPGHTFTGSLANQGMTGDLSGWTLRNLSAVIPEHFAFDFDLTVTATATELSNPGNQAITTGSLRVQITAIADAPDLGSATAITVNEDNPVPLNSVTTALVDRDGSETLSLFVRGLPAGVVITDGQSNHRVESSDPSEWINITGWNLPTLRLDPVTDSDQDFRLTFQLKATELENGSVAVTERTLDVTVTAVADAPDLEVTRSADQNEDTTFLIPVSTSLVDAVDGSETLRLTVTGVPAGAVISDGTLSNTIESTGLSQEINLTGWNLANLRITPRLHSGDDITLVFRSTATEARDNSSATTTANTVIVVRAVADAPTLTVSSPGGDEDHAIPLVISPALVDADGSESLRVVISGFPAGSRVTDGPHASLPGATSVDITGWNLDNLTITPPLNFNGTITLTVTATTTEGEHWAGQDTATTTLPLTVVVDPVNDAPDVDPTDMPTIDQTGTAVFDLRNYLGDVETSPNDFTFAITGYDRRIGLVTLSEDGKHAIFIPDPDFVGVATFTYSATDTGDNPGANPHSPTITRSGQISINVLRYQDLGDAPESYGTTAQNAGPRDSGGARHGGTHGSHPIRLGQTVGYGEPNGQPSDLADGDDEEVNGDDDEDGLQLMTGFSGAYDRPTYVTLRIEAPEGGRLDAWIDFDGNGSFDPVTERVVFDGNSRLVTGENGETVLQSAFTLDGTSLVLNPGMNYVRIRVPQRAVNFQDQVYNAETERFETVTRDEMTTYARFRVSTVGHLNPNGFAPDGEVEDYRITIENVTSIAGGAIDAAFTRALNEATDLTIRAYADELVADPGYTPSADVPMVFTGAGSGGDHFQRGETDQAFQDIVARVNQIIGTTAGGIENVFVFVTHPVDFVITDPQGRTAGHVDGVTFNNIGDNLTYSGDGAIELLVIRNASPGEYQIDFTGVGGVFRGGASLITANGTQQSTFQGGLTVSQAVSLSLDYAAPTLGTEGTQVAQAGGRGQVFFNVADGNGGDDDDDALSALSGLDAENESGDLTPREQIIRWIDAVRTNSKSLKRVLLDELEPDWLTEDSLETQNLLDEFWVGLGQSMLGGIPGQVFQLGEFLGVEVPLLFAAEPDGKPLEARTSGDAADTRETSSVESQRAAVAAATHVSTAGDEAGAEGAGGAGAIAGADAAADDTVIVAGAVFDGSPDSRRVAIDAIRSMGRGRRSLSGK